MVTGDVYETRRSPGLKRKRWSSGGIGDKAEEGKRYKTSAGEYTEINTHYNFWRTIRLINSSYKDQVTKLPGTAETSRRPLSASFLDLPFSS